MASCYRWLLLSVMVGTMASIMSSTIVNVAIPDMSRHFMLGQERAQWGSSGFMVALHGGEPVHAGGLLGGAALALLAAWRLRDAPSARA